MSSYPQQPQAVPSMNSKGGNRNSKAIPMGQNGRAWSFPLFDCLSDIPTCLVSWFLPCVTYSQNKHRYEHLASHGAVDPTQGGEIVEQDCLVYGCLTCCGNLGWVLQMGARGNVRERYNIEGNPAEDCLSAWCCAPCALTQQSRELELEERSLGAAGGGMVSGMVNNIITGGKAA